MNSDHAFIAHSFNDFCDVLFFGAFVIHTRSLVPPDLPFSGISLTPSRNAFTRFQGNEYASELSCDIGENGFRVVGREVTETFRGVGIESAAGAVCGEVSEREFGKTSVTSAW